MQKVDYDLDLIGLSTADLDQLLHPDGEEGLTDPDAIPEPPDEAITHYPSIVEQLASFRRKTGLAHATYLVDISMVCTF